VHDHLFAHDIEVLLTAGEQDDLVTFFDVDQIFEDFAVAANMTGEHDVAPFAGVGGAAVVPDGVFGDLPDGDLSPVLFCDFPADFDDF
jgi:hypothetical protein